MFKGGGRHWRVITPDPCRRRLLGAFFLGPVAATLAACGQDSHWPEGMRPIKWDRDTCVRCNMLISDRRFAAEMRGGPKDTVFKFDDIGCMVFWMRDKAAQFPWMAEAATRVWVADFAGQGERWLNPGTTHFVNRVSPMGYNFAAVGAASGGSVDFAVVRQRILALGK